MFFTHKSKLLYLSSITFFPLLLIYSITHKKNIYAETVNIWDDKNVLAEMEIYYRDPQAEVPKTQTLTEKQLKTQPPIKHEFTLRNRKIDRFNGTLWAGAEFMFTPKSFSEFVSTPMIGVQIGVSKSVLNVTEYSFLYLGVIFNYGHSQGSDVIDIVSTRSWYYFMNEEIVLGYEVPLGDPHIAIFAEAGPALQQFAFGIENTKTTDAIDYLATQTFAGAFNLGLNINLAPRNEILCLIRLGAKAIIGHPKTKTLNYNDENLNTNPFMFGPVVSIAIRK